MAACKLIYFATVQYEEVSPKLADIITKRQPVDLENHQYFFEQVQKTLY